jgi:eukaryotic-like serine/threonine-protein kinase
MSKKDANGGQRPPSPILELINRLPLDDDRPISPNKLLRALNIRLETDLSPPVNQGRTATNFGRYEIGGELGRGGMGMVLLARDLDLNRNVALKHLLKTKKISKRRISRFITEAQITAQLDHPNIMPVYEIGVLPEEGIYFTMKAVRGITLQEVLRRLRKRDPVTTAEYTDRRLLNIFLQVCMAVAYAHDRGVLHRDLKPANVMLGPFNEVLLMDWGLARVIGRDDLPGEPDEDLPSDDEGMVLRTRDGAMVGTPGYMSPEQLECREDRLDPRSDQFSLGAILYELITRRHAFPGKTPAEVQWRMKHSGLVPPHKRAPERNIPAALEEITLRALAMDPDDRFAGVLDLHHAVEEFLEGARRKDEAEIRVEVGREAFAKYAALRDVLLAQRVEALQAARELRGHASRELKRRVWGLEDQAWETEAEVAEAFNEAMTAFEHALSHDPENLAARQGLADLYWTRFQEAEQQHVASEADHYRRRLETYDDGRYAKLLLGEGRLSIETDPDDAEIYLYRYDERDRIQVPGAEQFLGYTPLRNEPIGMGTYLLIFHRSGFRDTRFPLYIGRRQRKELSVVLYRDEEIGDGLIHVPSGRYIAGGDAPSILAPDATEIVVDDYFISRFPVTNREYLAFINDLAAQSPEDAASHVPRMRRGGNDVDRPCWPLGDDGLYSLPEEEVDIPWQAEMPVSCVSWQDASAYCGWLSVRSGRTCRLPTEHEWEKAARGVDGRVFPWGRHFEAGHCKMRGSQLGDPVPEPVGSYPVDESPYGVRDMAGGVLEWCQEWHDEMPLLRVLRGGCWAFGERHCRTASRIGALPQAVASFYGFRVVVEVPGGQRGMAPLGARPILGRSR